MRLFMPKFHWTTTETRTAGTVVHIPVTVMLLIVIAVAALVTRVLLGIVK
jgi:hypothetical protein